MIRERTVQVGDLSLHTLESGDPEAGPPVLLLHGWPTNADLWRHALPAIGEHRHAIALDLPGFGESSKPLDASYSFRFYDRVLGEFLDAIGVDRLGLAVHDLGGPVGLHWAVGNRERVTDLVLLNTLVFPEMSWAVVAFVVASRLPGVREALTSPRGIDFSMRFGVVDRARLTDEVLARYRAPFASKAARRALLKTAHGLHPKGFRALAKGLADFDVPTSLIYGEEDRILPDVAKTMARVQAALPQATRVSIPGCGHFLQEDQPARVAELLAEALRLPG